MPQSIEALPDDPNELKAMLLAEQTEAGAPEAAENKSAAAPSEAARRRRRNHGALPAHLPRIETIVDVDDKVCPCRKGVLHMSPSASTLCRRSSACS